MKTALTTGIISVLLSMNAFASDSNLELLAGVEAGIESNTAMTTNDLEKTQKLLSSMRTGAQESWYNIDTTTHYNVKIGQHFDKELRPCVHYQLETKHSSRTEVQELDACLNYEGNWISMSKLAL